MMRKRICFLCCSLLIMSVLFVFTSSCKKEFVPELTTTEITDITDSTAISGGNVTSDGGLTVTARGLCWSSKQTPTVSDNKTVDGSGTGSFVSNISGLFPNTMYYIRAYATNAKGTAYGNTMSFTTSCINSFTDSRDGNVYKIVTIGNQVWMAENLRYLPSVAASAAGSNTALYYYVYGYNGTDVNAAKATANYQAYGVLYNWEAAKLAAPAGWHLPSDEEWTELTTYLGGESVAGDKLKEIGTTHWSTNFNHGTNETGFTAIPGGHRNGSGAFFEIGYMGFWWSTTELGEMDACARSMDFSHSNVTKRTNKKVFGFSVRCVKD